MVKKTKDEIIDEVLTGFDFDKVLRVMNFLNWKWSLTEMNHYELIKVAKKLLSDSYDGAYKNECKEFISATGGFTASGFVGSDFNIELFLSFIIENSEYSSIYDEE